MPSAGTLPLVLGLQCVRCERETALGAPGYVCPACGANQQVLYDYPALRRRLTRRRLERDRDFSIWRYRDLLPAGDKRHRPTLQVGWTPLYKAERLGSLLGLSNLYLKDDGRNPSASFKDRAGAVVVARARSLGRKIAAGASTGNAAASLACLAAGTELKPVVFVPKSAPEAKVVQLLIYGATVFAVDGSYDDAFDLCLAACEEYGWYNRNTGYNAFTREGKKTVSFELAEQSGWKVPDTVFVPVGDGNIISGVWKGFVELEKLGLIDTLPRLAAVQAEGSAAITRAFESGATIEAAPGKTVADSIAVCLPRDGEAAVRALKESKGFAITVSDAEILAAVKTAARTEGVFAEPAAAAGVAGCAKAAAAGKLRQSERVVVIITGSGLKDVASARKAVGKSHAVRPNLKDLKRLIASLPKGALP